MTNSADPNQLASEEANLSGATLFAKTGHVLFSKRRVKLVLACFTLTRLQQYQEKINCSTCALSKD